MKQPVLTIVITIIKKVLKFGLGLFFILLCGSYILLGTDKGFRFLINSAHDLDFAPVQFSHVKGNLLGQLDIIDFNYTDATIIVSIKKFHLDWQAAQLFNRKLKINSIIASGVHIEQLASSAQHETQDQSTTQKMTQLPEINLPVPVFLKQLQLTDITFIRDPASVSDSEAISIETLQLKAELINNQLKLHQLNLMMPEAKASIHGSARLLKNYPLSLHSEITLHIPEQADLTLTGEIKGDLMKLQVMQHSSGLLDASINAEILHLLDNINWNADIQINQLPLALLIPDNKHYLDTQISIKGDLNQANIVIKTNTDHSSLNKLNNLEIDGIVSWHDGIKWQATLLTTKFNPEIFQKDWPGSLDINLQTSGQLSDEDYRATIQLNKITVQLKQKAIAGEGHFDIDNTLIAIKQLNLSSGEANLKINGTLAEQNNLDWALTIKQLSDILPQAQGSINGKGSLKGTTQQPVLDAALHLSNIVYENIHLKSADLIGVLDSNPSKPSDINFNVQHLELDAQHLEDLKLTLKGPLQNHNMTINAQHELAILTLAAQGGLDTEQLIWNGQIKHSAVNSKKTGKWIQIKSTKLLAGTKKVLLSPLCLQSSLQKNVSTLCAQIDWQPEHGKAQLSLDNLSFQHFQSYLPDEVTRFSGALDITANINLAPQLQAQIKVEIQPGELRYQAMAQQTITLSHKNGLLEAIYNSQQLAANGHLEMGPHIVKGNLTIPRIEIEEEPLTAAINGNIDLAINDLKILTLLAPQITDIDGQLLAKLQLGGQVGTPRITGQANFIADYLSIRDIGIRIEDININLTEKNAGQELALQGSLRSGNGQLEVDGLLSLNAEQGWPVNFNFNLKGGNFLAINTPDAYVILSPDIQFSQQKGLMHITGDILVPEAAITPAEIPEDSISISGDVEILGSEKEPPTNLELDITLTLGNKVQLDAFGLNASLRGELTIKQKAKQLMTGNGELHLINGTFRAYGQDLTIDKGSIFYAGGYLDNPGLKLTASRKVSDIQVGIKVSGSAKKPNISTFSDNSSLETKDIISMMLTGQKVDNLDKAKIYAGHKVSKGLSVGVNAGMGDEGSEFVTRYKLTDKIQLEGTSSTSKNAGSIVYTFEVE
ncbi:MAG: translocation/assembly module TamB domain-containing protein [Thiohalomonas sp.]|nr:translocation/assembly module TamB domain-containing protein [Thiohalomonas sp.]